MKTDRKSLEKIVCRERFTKSLMTMKMFEKKLNRRSEDKRADFKPDNIVCPNCKIPNALIWIYEELYCEVCNAKF